MIVYSIAASDTFNVRIINNGPMTPSRTVYHVWTTNGTNMGELIKNGYTPNRVILGNMGIGHQEVLFFFSGKPI